MNGCKDPSSLPDQENGRNLLVKDEMSKYQIVLSSEAEASEVTAANELKKYIKSISGCSLEITDDTSAPSGHEIVIGQTARDVYGDFDWEWMGEEGYTVQMKDFTLVIAGGSGRGTERNTAREQLLQSVQQNSGQIDFAGVGRRNFKRRAAARA